VLQSPRELRDTFKLLARLDDGLDLGRLLERIDWHGVTPQQVSYAVLGRLPQDIYYSGLAAAPFEPAAYFRSLLLGAEFQSNIVSNLLGAYPEKPRRFFVHIPRSGGTSLGETLATHCCTIAHNAIGPEWCSGEAFLQCVAKTCRDIAAHDAIHVSGHYTLRFIVESGLARFGDSVWTSVRAPQDIVLSYMNYVLTLMQEDDAALRPDTRTWAKQLGLDGPLGTPSPERLRTLLARMLRDDTLLPRNLLCHFLGNGTADSALDLMAAADIEVIDSARLDTWREQRWAVAPPPWANRSRRFYTWDSLSDGERRQISALIRQDVALYRAIATSMGDGVSVQGTQIARSSATAGLPIASAPSRTRRASRPILLDPGFVRLPTATEPGGGARVGWADPPLNYQTIETTLQLPLFQTRIRVRYARRKPGRAGSARRQHGNALRHGLHRLFRRLSGILAR
jgi:hypothetical protein